MKKLMVYGPIAMALIAALAVGIPAAVAADTSDAVSTETSTTTNTDEQNPRQELMSRVAEILDIDEATVSDAFQQASQEMMTERQQERLQNAIDNGLITEEEAAQIQAWWDSRPAALEKLAPRGQNQPMGPRGMMGPAVASENASDTVPAITSNTDKQKPREEILSNVANILGIDETVLSDAFQQATQELGIGPLGDQGRGQMMGPADDFAFCAP